MNQNFVVRMKDQIFALWTLCLSIRKHDWELNDYPVVLREQEPDPEYVGTRLKFHRYRALIVNWWVVSGLGDTKEEALQDLDKQFTTQKLERGKLGKALRVPVRGFRFNLLLENGLTDILSWQKTLFAVFSTLTGLGFQMSPVCGISITTKPMTR